MLTLSLIALARRDIPHEIPLYLYVPNLCIMLRIGANVDLKHLGYGIAAGAGKIGAVMMQLTYMKFDHEGLRKPNSSDLGYLMYIFAFFMLLVAIIAWLYIPRVQSEGGRDRATTCICVPGHIVPPKTLEELAEGREKVEPEDRVGSKERVDALRKRLRR